MPFLFHLFLYGENLTEHKETPANPRIDVCGMNKLLSDIMKKRQTLFLAESDSRAVEKGTQTEFCGSKKGSKTTQISGAATLKNGSHTERGDLLRIVRGLLVVYGAHCVLYPLYQHGKVLAVHQCDSLIHVPESDKCISRMNFQQLHRLGW